MQTRSRLWGALPAWAYRHLPDGGTGLLGACSPTGSKSETDDARANGSSGQPNLGGDWATGGTLSLAGATANAGAEIDCNDLTVDTREVTPTVLLLVDDSSSMFEPRDKSWDPLYDVLQQCTPTRTLAANYTALGETSFRLASLAALAKRSRRELAHNCS